MTKEDALSDLYNVVFFATIPPLGVTTYFLKYTEEARIADYQIMMKEVSGSQILRWRFTISQKMN